MKIVTLFSILWMVSLFAQESGENIPPIYIGPEEQIKLPERARYKGQPNSLIPWDKLVPHEYMDLSLWKKALALKDKEPNWQRNIIERRMREMVGRVLECRGDCRVYRGLGFANVQYKSAILEGDEVITMGNSYIWLYLFDGTLVRISPDSSISFKEINIGEKENFLHARLNSGNILWLARHKARYKTKPVKETDTLFLPLSNFKANPRARELKVDENNLFAILEDDRLTDLKFKRLNQLIATNNESLFEKPTYSYLVFHNGTVFGKNLSAEFIVLVGDKSYFKLRDKEQLGLDGEIDEPEATFYFRGFENRDEEKVGHGKWFEVDPKGRALSDAENTQLFAPGEFLTSNIPSIYIARELMAKIYSLFAHIDVGKRELALNFGYRLWTSI